MPTNSLIAHIKKYAPLTTAEEALVHRYTEAITLPKKEHLLKEGQLCKGDYFIAQGCLRMYFINEKGVEQITHFAIENWWLADYKSLLQSTPSANNIQAIEHSTVVLLTTANKAQLVAQVPAVGHYLSTVQQHAYAAAQARIRYQYSMSREEQYWHFLEHFPEFAQRIPQYMLASFLGFTPEYLSELRKKKA